MTRVHSDQTCWLAKALKSLIEAMPCPLRREGGAGGDDGALTGQQAGPWPLTAGAEQMHRFHQV